MEAPRPLRDLIRSQGPIGFDRFVEWALYEPGHGFFARGGGAGRRTGDFITSAEVGPLFGAVLARWLDGTWDALGRPDPFPVAEAGAGRGALALAVRAAAPRCAGALTYTLVERSGSLRRLQAEHLDLAPTGAGTGTTVGAGPRFLSAARLPSGPLLGAVVGNELLDNLPFRLVESTGGGWAEVVVDLDGDGSLREGLRGLPDADATRCSELAPGAPTGARVALQDRAAAWVHDVLGRLERGRLLLFDYGCTTAELAARPVEEWLRTYVGHRRGASPLSDVGAQDITVEVALDQLPGAPRACRQREWLEANGMGELVDAARREWSERASVGDLRALRARSAPLEASALGDPCGLGDFWALEWTVPPAG